MNDIVINCQEVTKTFVEGETPVQVLKDLNLTVKAKDKIAIIGASGSGKSTLLHILGGLDKPTSGKVLVAGDDIARLSQKRLSLMRNRHLGFIYQFHHLLPEFDALENVCMPLLLGRASKKEAIEKAKHLLNKVGLAQRYHHRPAQLSGGEKQRVAIARALVTEPKCVLADEPTGNLDPHTAEKVYESMLHLNQEVDTALLIATHDANLASHMERRLTLSEGQLVPDVFRAS